MTNTPQLIELITIAVATLAGVHILGRLYMRSLKVEILRYKCEFQFQRTVLNNDSLPPSVRTRIILAYREHRKGYLELLLSRRPLQVEYWFNQEQIDAFFNEPKTSGLEQTTRAYTGTKGNLPGEDKGALEKQ